MILKPREVYEEVKKLTFRALALRQSDRRRANARTLAFLLFTVANLRFQLSC